MTNLQVETLEALDRDAVADGEIVVCGGRGVEIDRVGHPRGGVPSERDAGGVAEGGNSSSRGRSGARDGGRPREPPGASGGRDTTVVSVGEVGARCARRRVLQCLGWR